MTEWLLLKFSDNYADEFDVEAIVLTTRDRWERAKADLCAAYPGGATFDAGFGMNESNSYDAYGYLRRFSGHAVSLECARDMARALGRIVPKTTYEDRKLLSLSWMLIVKHGILPRVPDEPLADWLLLLAFPAPPAKCAAHGNIIGECDEGRSDATPWAPPCRREGVRADYIRDADYDALMSAETRD